MSSKRNFVKRKETREALVFVLHINLFWDEKKLIKNIQIKLQGYILSTQTLLFLLIIDANFALNFAFLNYVITFYTIMPLNVLLEYIRK